MPHTMTPGDRRQLAGVVRQRMRVLRAEVKQRKSELFAAAEQRLHEKYAAEDHLFDEFHRKAADIAQQANGQLRELMEQYGDQFRAGRWGGNYLAFGQPRVTRLTEDRAQLHRAMITGIAAQVEHALVSLDRQEADLLTQLAIEGLESDAAREFMARIPNVAELVPAARLKEIEAQFDQQQRPEQIP